MDSEAIYGLLEPPAQPQGGEEGGEEDEDVDEEKKVLPGALGGLHFMSPLFLRKRLIFLPAPVNMKNPYPSSMTILCRLKAGLTPGLVVLPNSTRCLTSVSVGVTPRKATNPL